jgi:hypothetical protein
MSAFVPGLLVGYALGVASMCGLVGLYLLHRPRYVAPTMRRHRDRLPEVHNVPPMPVCKPARDAEVGGIRYEHLGMTGLEE